MSEGFSLRVNDLIYGLKKRWKLILLFVVAGLVAGLILSGMSWLKGNMTRNYSIHVSAVFIPENENSTYSSKGATYTIDDYRIAELMADTVKYVMKSDSAAQHVINNIGLVGIEPEDITESLTIEVQAETPILEFSLNWRNADEGISILNEYIMSSTTLLQGTLGIGTLSAIGVPSSQYIVGSVSRIPTWGLTTILGFLAGIIVIVFEISINPKLINSNDVQPQFELETIGNIPLDEPYFKQTQLLNSNEDLDNPIEQHYAAAAYILKNRLGKGIENKTIYFTSTMKGEGKSSYASHIAMHLAEMEHKVLLIDFDLKCPTIGSYFTKTTEWEKSFNALYRGEITKDEAIIHATGYLDVLPSILEHRPITIDTAVLDLVKELKKDYDYVLIDVPPISETTDVLSLNEITDAVLLVIGFDMASKQEIKNTIDKLDKSGVKLLGALVNKSKDIINNEKYTKNTVVRNKTSFQFFHKKQTMPNKTEQPQNAVTNEQEFTYRNVLTKESLVNDTQQKLSDDEIKMELIKMSLNSQEPTT